jgi:hypothetical protein
MVGLINDDVESPVPNYLYLYLYKCLSRSAIR